MSSDIPQFQMTRRIRMAETDGSGYAYFATYIRLMEETEYAFLRSRGLCVVLKDSRGTIGFPRLSAEIEVLHPAVFDQEIQSCVRLISSDGKKIEYEFQISTRPESNPSVAKPTADEVIVATGTFVVACCRFPDDALPYAILTPEFVLEALRVRET